MLWVAKRFFKLFPQQNVRPRVPNCAFAGSSATTTFSVVNCSVCFRAEAKFASMADMRREAAILARSALPQKNKAPPGALPYHLNARLSPPHFPISCLAFSDVIAVVSTVTVGSTSVAQSSRIFFDISIASLAPVG